MCDRLFDKHRIGRQQASKDINAYLNDIAPGNLQYDKYLKGYVPTPHFAPKLTTGTADQTHPFGFPNTFPAKSPEIRPQTRTNTRISPCVSMRRHILHAGMIYALASNNRVLAWPINIQINTGDKPMSAAYPTRSLSRPNVPTKMSLFLT